MEPEVQPTSTNPSAMLASLVGKRKKLQEELRAIEKQVYELETSYLHDSSQCGNVLKGFEGFLSSSKSTTNGLRVSLQRLLWLAVVAATAD